MSPSPSSRLAKPKRAASLTSVQGMAAGMFSFSMVARPGAYLPRSIVSIPSATMAETV